MTDEMQRQWIEANRVAELQEQERDRYRNALDQVQTTPDPWGPARLAQLNAVIEASSIAEYERLIAQQRIAAIEDDAEAELKIVYAERDRYKAALGRIAWDFRDWPGGVAAREALQQEQA